MNTEPSDNISPYEYTATQEDTKQAEHPKLQSVTEFKFYFFTVLFPPKK